MHFLPWNIDSSLDFNLTSTNFCHMCASYSIFEQLMLLEIPAIVMPLCYQHIHSVTSIDTHGSSAKQRNRSIHFRIAARSGPQSMTIVRSNLEPHVDALPTFLGTYIHIIYTYIYHEIQYGNDCHQSLCTTCGIWITIHDTRTSVSPGHTSCSPCLQLGHPSDVLPLLRFRRFPFGFFGQSSGTTKPKGWASKQLTVANDSTS